MLRREEERRHRETIAAAAKKTAAQSGSPKSTSSSRKQSKREQRMMGVSLPKEHMDFFQRNMRIGLAHPRASRTRRGSEGHMTLGPFGMSNDDSESELSASDSDSDSDLSDELARLDLDDLDWMSSSGASGGLRRSKTYVSGVAEHKEKKRSQRNVWARLPDEPGADRHTPLRRRNTYEDQMAGSYGSLSTTPRPSPFHPSPSPTQSPIREDEGEDACEDPDGTLRASDRLRAQKQLQERPFHATMKRDEMDPGNESEGANDSQRHPRREESSSRPDNVAGDRQDRRSGNDPDGSTSSTSTPKADPPLLSFNSLPNKAQYLILKYVSCQSVERGRADSSDLLLSPVNSCGKTPLPPPPSSLPLYPLRRRVLPTMRSAALAICNT